MLYFLSRWNIVIESTESGVKMRRSRSVFKVESSVRPAGTAYNLIVVSADQFSTHTTRDSFSPTIEAKVLLTMSCEKSPFHNVSYSAFVFIIIGLKLCVTGHWQDARVKNTPANSKFFLIATMLLFHVINKRGHLALLVGDVTANLGIGN
jgi:hypothetical protein